MSFTIDAIDLDTPFSEQLPLKLFLETPSQGPVSEVLLYRLLAVAEQIIKREIDSTDSKLISLQLGYRLRYVSNLILDGNIEIYSVRWGEDIFDAANLQPPATSLRSTSVSLELIEKLINRFNEEIIRQTPVLTAEDRTVSVFLFAGILEPRSSHSPLNHPMEFGLQNTQVHTSTGCNSGCERKTVDGVERCYKKNSLELCDYPCPTCACPD
jgi:hypothetical protein